MKQVSGSRKLNDLMLYGRPREMVVDKIKNDPNAILKALNDAQNLIESGQGSSASQMINQAKLMLSYVKEQKMLAEYNKVSNNIAA